jgi:type IV pilus assembly protein PilN
MIRINLLPRKVSRKKMTAIRHLALGGGLIAIVLVAMAYTWIIMGAKVGRLRQEITRVDAEIKKLENVNKDKEIHQKNLAELKRRLDVISEVEKGRVVYLHIMDEMTLILDDSKMHIWLNQMNFNQGKLQLDGVAFTNENISEFLRRLDQSPYLKNANLILSQKSKGKDATRDMYSFSLTAEVETPQGG